MHHQKKLANNASRDNEAFEDEERRKYTEKAIRNNSDIDLIVRKNFSDRDDDHLDQPIYIGRDQPICCVLHSTAPDLFIEFDFLYLNPKTNTRCWVEGSRWLIYEEDYDIDLKRFGSPHLSTMSIKGLKSFKKLFKNGNLSLNDRIRNYLDILKVYSDSASDSGKFTNEELMDIRKALTFNHYHSGMHLPTHSHAPPSIIYNYDKQCFEMSDFQGAPMTRNTRSSRRRSSTGLSENIHRVLSNKKLEERLHAGTEGLLVQVGVLDTIRETHSLFIRLESLISEDGLMDAQCPLRFLYIIFGPKSREDELMEVGRVFSIMMSNREFREAAYNTESTDTILEASRKFVDCSALIHLNKRINGDTLAHCLPHLKSYATRITAEQHQVNLDKRVSMKDDKLLNILRSSDRQEKYRSSMTITSTGLESDEKTSKIKRVMKQFVPPFHQVYLDLKGIKSRYLSDYKDAFTAENAPLVFTGIIFVYFVVLSPAITFGALFNTLVTPKMTITMLLVASGAYQLIYVLLSGQPLEIVGVTPTMFVVEQVLSSLSVDLSVQLEVMRFWIGIYVSALGFIFTMFNGVVIVQHFRRSVEEVYNTYFSTIFILSSLFTMFKALPYVATPLNETAINATVYFNERKKFGTGGATLFLALVMLNFCLYMVKINRGIYLRRSIRKMLGAFNVPLGIILVVALNLIFFKAYDLPTLNIPESNKVNYTLWINIPPFADVFAAPGAVHIYCFCIGVSMFFMLIVEVATNSISVAKVERKLQKPIMYSINILIIIVFFPLLSIFLGWPFYSGAMVRSNAHCMAMAKWSMNTVPGVPKQLIGECEQRISGLIVGALVLLSVFLGSILRYIPMASMYGMFLYMGVMGISDMTLWKRLINLMQRRKHWRDHDYLKEFPTWNIVTLVSIQTLFVIILIILYVLSQFTMYVWTLFLFPVFVGMYAILRGYVLPCWPRLNTHLSKMDKKHVVKLFDGGKQYDFKTDINLAIENKTNSDEISTKSDSESEIY